MSLCSPVPSIKQSNSRCTYSQCFSAESHSHAVMHTLKGCNLLQGTFKRDITLTKFCNPTNQWEERWREKKWPNVLLQISGARKIIHEKKQTVFVLKSILICCSFFFFPWQNFPMGLINFFPVLFNHLILKHKCHVTGFIWIQVRYSWKKSNYGTWITQYTCRTRLGLGTHLPRPVAR